MQAVVQTAVTPTPLDENKVQLQWEEPSAQSIGLQEQRTKLQEIDITTN